MRFALTKVGPRAGTRYSVARKAKRENPREVWSAGRAGIGSRRGLTTSHAATGTSPKRRIEGKGLGRSVIEHVSGTAY